MTQCLDESYCSIRPIGVTVMATNDSNTVDTPRCSSGRRPVDVDFANRTSRSRSRQDPGNEDQKTNEKWLNKSQRHYTDLGGLALCSDQWLIADKAGLNTRITTGS